MSLDAAPALHLGPPREAFFDPGWFERDMETIFMPRWQFAGHIDDLREPGAYFKYVIGEYEVIVCRRSDGGVAAYHNVCRHRAYRLLDERKGKLRRNLTCGYHGWSYSRDDGTCVSATRMPEGFDRCAWGLRRVWVENFHGLIFVCLADEPPEPIATAAASLLDAGGGLSGYDMDGMRVAATEEWMVNANWKVVKENDDECYHCALNHPELARSYDPWSNMSTNAGEEPDLDAQWTTQDWAKIDLGRAYSQGRICEIPLPRTDGPGSFEAEDAQLFWLAGGHLIFINDYARLSSFIPIGPQQTLQQYWWFVAQDAVEDRDYKREDLMELLSVTSRQDIRLCEEVQRGLRMPSYSPGPLNLDHQAPIAAFYRWYEQQLAAHATA